MDVQISFSLRGKHNGVGKEKRVLSRPSDVPTLSKCVKVFGIVSKAIFIEQIAAMRQKRSSTRARVTRVIERV